MASGRGNLQCPLHIFLAHDVLQIGEAFGAGLGDPDRGGGEGGFAFQVRHQRLHIGDTVDRQAAGEGRLGGVFRRDKQLPDSGLFRGHGHGQHAGHAPQRAGEAQFA